MWSEASCLSKQWNTIQRPSFEPMALPIKAHCINHYTLHLHIAKFFLQPLVRSPLSHHPGNQTSHIWETYWVLTNALAE